MSSNPIRPSYLKRSPGGLLLLLSLLILLVGLYSCSSGNSYDKLVEKRLLPYSPSADRDVTSLPSPNWQLGISKYEAGEYEAMQDVFRKIKPGNAYYYKSHYVMGLVALQQHRPFDALDEFKAVRTNPESKYFKDAQWYMALAYLQAGISGRTKDILNAILRDEKHHYHKQAKELLDELK